MARAYTDPAFQHDLKKIRGLEGEGRLPPGFSVDCLRCHAPIAYYRRDPEVRTEASREGVTCSFCHSVVGVVAPDEKTRTFQVDFGRVIYGPSDPPKETPAHAVRHSPIFRKGELCMMCHHDTSRGTPNELTWLEYQESAYPGLGIRCQDCHMRGQDSHRFPGGHSDSPLLAGVAGVTIEAAEDGKVRVRVSNVGAGHHFPTRGAHEQELKLSVELRGPGGEVVESGSRSFRYGFVDASGMPQRLNEPSAPIVEAHDNTIPPRQSRLETFMFSKLRPGREIRAYLEYSLVPEYRRRVYPPDVYQNHFRPVRIAEATYTIRTDARPENLER